MGSLVGKDQKRHTRALWRFSHGPAWPIGNTPVAVRDRTDRISIYSFVSMNYVSIWLVARCLLEASRVGANQAATAFSFPTRLFQLMERL
jgi:hypothetical protein